MKKKKIKAIMPEGPRVGGRPKKELNENDFEALCAQQNTVEEIASRFRVDVNTVNAWCHRTYGKGFSETFAEKRHLGFSSLRSALYRNAVINEVPSVQMWLSKQWLGMTEKLETNQTITTQNSTDESINRLVQALQGLASRG